MKQNKCRHGAYKAHLQPDPETRVLAVCPGPLELKVEATTTKEGDITSLRDDVETKTIYDDGFNHG